jgi:hypothetical protein
LLLFPVGGLASCVDKTGSVHYIVSGKVEEDIEVMI